jgi:putative ABC transport system permease protein
VDSVRWRKVVGDLLAYRARTALVVASIATGVFAVGAIVGSDAILGESLDAAAEASRPANATFYTATGFDRELVDAVETMPGVAEAEGRRSVIVRLVAVDGAEAGSRELQLTAIPDFADQRIDLVEAESGAFPPRRGEIALERSAQRVVDIAPGQAVTIRTPGGDEHRLDVAGLAHEPGASPAFYFGRLNGYVTFETLEDLGWTNDFDELRIRADDPTAAEADIRSLADDVRQRIERAGTPVTFALIPEPGKHPSQELIGAVFLVLGFLGFLSLLVGGFLVVNTIAVIMAQQTRQIGIMKAVGGTRRQIAGMYLALVLAYALVALAIAIPLAAIGSYLLAVLAAGLLNFDVTRVLVPLNVIVLEVAIGVLVPVVAALVPVLRGARVTVHDALADPGVTEHFGHGALDRLLGRLRGLSRPVLLSIRNTFRRKGRLVLTLAALAIGGSVFMTIFTVRSSLSSTLEDTVRYFDYDVQVELAEPTRSERVVEETLRVPGVVAAEPWRFASSIRVRPDGSESGSLVTFGLPEDTRTVDPIIVAGRWLLPGEGNAVVATANIVRDEPDLELGDPVVLRVNGREATWTLVGIVQSPTMAPFLYVGSGPLDRVTGRIGEAGIVMVKTDDHGPEAQATAARAVREQLEAAGIGVAAPTTPSDVMGTIDTLFTTLVLFVSVMAVLLGVVGGLGLAGTMTMNVVERAREIGIIRAIGATRRAVLLIFVTEGVMIGLLAWGIGAGLSLPLSKLISDQLGDVFVQRPLAFSPSLEGFAMWLAVVLVLSVLGSIAPAWRAARMAVREVLAYE